MSTLAAFDFDGTLAALRRKPSAARLSTRRRALLRRLAAATGVRLLVVSGRPLRFLRRALAGTGAALAGDHGWEMQGIGPRWRHPRLARRARQARVLAAAARRACAPWPGTLVELKTVSVAVHYRLNKRARRSPGELAGALSALLGPSWRLAGGKLVMELRPRERWGKGELLRLAARRLAARVIFAGDDATDEEAFQRLSRRARTIKVGPGPTAARERVSGMRAVDGLLRSLAR